MSEFEIWSAIRLEAIKVIETDCELTKLLERNVLSHNDFRSSLLFILAQKLVSNDVEFNTIFEFLSCVTIKKPELFSYAIIDMAVFVERDPAIDSYLSVFLFSKGYLALEAHRFANSLWNIQKKYLALYIQNRCSEIFGVDIHPAARVGKGIFIDHATGIVVGETSVIGDNVSLLHEVTLGGTGKTSGDRHPKIEEDVMIGAGAKILGNITIGKGSKIAAGSVVLKNVQAFTTVAGVPAIPVGSCSTIDHIDKEASSLNF